MCIIAGEVQSVSGTKILVMPSFDGERQLVVYTNHVSTDHENVMILPVPYPRTVRFEEHLMTYKRLFEDLKDSMIWPPTEKVQSAASWNAYRSALPVIQVGSYQVSIVPSVGELNQLDTSVFSVSKGLMEMLDKEYGGVLKPFGFLCCKLLPGEQTYEPIAYSHRRWKEDMLFVPTKHYHDHGLGMEEADWDHEIYSLGTVQDTNKSLARPKKIHSLDNTYLPRDYRYQQITPVRCFEVKGGWKNIDLEFRIDTIYSLREDTSEPKNVLGEPTYKSKFWEWFRG